MKQLNDEFEGRLTNAIAIFEESTEVEYHQVLFNECYLGRVFFHGLELLRRGENLPYSD